MAITHEDNNIPQLRINEFRSQSDYLAAVNAGEVSENDINFIQEIDDEIIATTDSLGVVRSSEVYDSEKHVTAVAINPEDGKIYTDNKVFFATYGSTTYSEIRDALNNNRIVICLYNARYYTLRNDYNSSAFYFYCSLGAATGGTDMYLWWICVNTSNAWSNGKNKLGTVTTVKMNGSNKTIDTSGALDLGTVITDVSGKEDTSNKTTTITEDSTDTQYPSAKSVYTELTSRPTIKQSEPKWLEYIEGDGSSWIDTGIVPNHNIGVSVSYEPISTSFSGFYFIVGSGVSYQIATRTTENSYYASLYDSSANIKTFTGTSGVNIVSILNKKLTVNGTDYGTLTTKSSSTFNEHFYLFNGNNTSNANIGKIRIYSCQFYDVDGNIVRNFRPALDPITEKAGLYDTIERKFYSNQGTGNFGYNETFETLQSIKGDHNSWINTGIAASGDIRQSIKLEASELGDTYPVAGYRSSSSNNKNYIMIGSSSGNTSGLYLEYGSNSQTISNSHITIGVPITIESKFEDDELNWYVNNTLTNKSYAKQSITASGNMLLFYMTGYNSNSHVPFAGYIYYYKLYNINTLVLDLIPVRKADETVCMYDFISGSYLENQGTGTFYGVEKENSVVLYNNSGIAIYPTTKDTDVITSDGKTLDEKLEEISGAVSEDLINTPNGIAGLDENGKLSEDVIPESVAGGVFEGILYSGEFYKDDSYTDKYTPATGKLYLDTITKKLYRWNNVSFEVVSGTLEIGETATTATRGDYGIVAYNHATETKIDEEVDAGIYKISITENGHVATAEEVTIDDLATLGATKDSDLKPIAKSGLASDCTVSPAIDGFGGENVQAVLASIHQVIEDNEYVIARALDKIDKSVGFSDDYSYVAPTSGTLTGATSVINALVKINAKLAELEAGGGSSSSSSSGSGDSGSGSTGGISTILQSLTWSQLKTDRDAGTLIPGALYRITDYTTTTSATGTRSAGNNFDLIVTALSSNSLSENCQAILHSGSSYFNNSKLSCWEIKYCLDNSTGLYPWASSSGKGVIYYMKDEYGNEAGYDFKNIQFSYSGTYYYTFSNSTNGSDLTLSGTANNNRIASSTNLPMNIFKGSQIKNNFVSSECSDIVILNNVNNCHFTGEIKSLLATNTPALSFCTFSGKYNYVTIGTATSSTLEITNYEFKGAIIGTNGSRKTISPISRNASTSTGSRIIEANTNGAIVDYCIADIFTSRTV